MFSFLPVEEIDGICAGDINQAKERLAWEVTKEIHGKDAADKALAGAHAAFGGGGDKESMPAAELPAEVLAAGIGAVDLFFTAGLGATKSDIRRLIEQGGASVNGAPVTDVKTVFTTENLQDSGDGRGELILRAGKKKFVRVVCRRG